MSFFVEATSKEECSIKERGSVIVRLPGNQINQCLAVLTVEFYSIKTVLEMTIFVLFVPSIMIFEPYFIAINLIV